MGILARFKDIMRVNVNALLERTEAPEKTVEAYMRSLSSDLGQVEAEAAAVIAAEQRARRALTEGEAEVNKLQRYADKAAESGDSLGAAKFAERKQAAEAKLGELQATYDQAAGQAARMKLMQEKLTADFAELSARHEELKGKLAAAKFQQDMGAARSSGAGSAFAAMEEKASMALYEAEALAELKAGKKEEDLDVLMAKLEREMEQAEQTRVKTDGESGSAGQSADPSEQRK